MNNQNATPNYANIETLNPADISVWRLYRQRFWPLVLLALILLIVPALIEWLQPFDE